MTRARGVMAGRLVVVATLVGVASALAAGCSSGGAAGEYLEPVASCPTVETSAGASAPATASGAPAGVAPLAEGFVPVSAVRCRFALAGNAWRVEVWQRSAGPFDDLVRALRMPPDSRDRRVECAGVAVAPITITLIDASGRTVTPAIPADPCGQRIQAVDQALDALTWETLGGLGPSN